MRPHVHGAPLPQQQRPLAPHPAALGIHAAHAAPAPHGAAAAGAYMPPMQHQQYALPAQQFQQLQPPPVVQRPGVAGGVPQAPAGPATVAAARPAAWPAGPVPPPAGYAAAGGMPSSMQQPPTAGGQQLRPPGGQDFPSALQSAVSDARQPPPGSLQPPPSDSIYGSTASYALDSVAKGPAGASPTYAAAAGSIFSPPTADSSPFTPPTAVSRPAAIPVNVSIVGSDAGSSVAGQMPAAASASALRRWCPGPDESGGDASSRTRVSEDVNLRTRVAEDEARASKSPMLPSPKTPVGSDEHLDKVLAEHGYEVAREEGSRRPGMPPGALGKGAFGMVYKARRRRDGQLVALKLTEQASASIILEKEIGVLQMLNHPSIVRFFEAFAHRPSDWMFIAMELVDGGDLLAALTLEPHVFEESLVRPLVFHVACGLAHAHEMGVVHRDLKPENVLLRRRDRFPKVADFGLGRVMRSEMAMTVAGTPTYMAPEIQDRLPYDFPADVYSLGCVFADMLDERHCCHWYVKATPGANHEKMRKNGLQGRSLRSFPTLSVS
eukprot:gb/GFBE01046400.1/.p1 GENE.gb/GFBE01046400.1/~~gb/GFBE01046400.1/.p1  ORF type:complete len:551 (+),score=89.61 gb/GFBE01046400.1/:1-1653(+)